MTYMKTYLAKFNLRHSFVISIRNWSNKTKLGSRLALVEGKLATSSLFKVCLNAREASENRNKRFDSTATRRTDAFYHSPINLSRD